MAKPRPPTVAERGQTVRFALESWSRTIRLCLIYVARGSPVLGMLPWLIRH